MNTKHIKKNEKTAKAVKKFLAKSKSKSVKKATKAKVKAKTSVKKPAAKAAKAAKATKVVKLPPTRANVKLVTPKTWTGDTLYAECKAQGIYPSFDGGNFAGYFDKHTSKKALTQLPTLSSLSYEAYRKAEAKAAGKTYVEPKHAETKAESKSEPKAHVEKAEKPAPNTELKPGMRVKRITFPVDRKITKVTKVNPRRAGSAAYVGFELYKPGMTVGEFLATKGSHCDILRRDFNEGHILVEGVIREYVPKN